MLGTLMSCVHSWRAASRTGEWARFWGGGSGDGSQAGELPGCWGSASCDGLACGGVFVLGLRGPSFLPHFKGQALPGGNNLTQGLLGIHCPASLEASKMAAGSQEPQAGLIMQPPAHSHPSSHPFTLPLRSPQGMMPG